MPTKGPERERKHPFALLTFLQPCISVCLASRNKDRPHDLHSTRDTFLFLLIFYTFHVQRTECAACVTHYLLIRALHISKGN